MGLKTVEGPCSREFLYGSIQCLDVAVSINYGKNFVDVLQEELYRAHWFLQTHIWNLDLNPSKASEYLGSCRIRHTRTSHAVS